MNCRSPRTCSGRTLPAQREKIFQELELHEDEKFPIELDRKVYHGRAVLDPGLHQLIYLEREESRGELFFFERKKVERKRLKLAAPVEVREPAGQPTATAVNYKQLDQVASGISEIQTPQRTFVFFDSAGEEEAISDP